MRLPRPGKAKLSTAMGKYWAARMSALPSCAGSMIANCGPRIRRDNESSILPTAGVFGTWANSPPITESNSANCRHKRSGVRQAACDFKLLSFFQQAQLQYQQTHLRSLLLLAQSGHGEEVNSELARQLELMNSLTKTELQLEFQQLDAKMQAHLNEIEHQNDLIQTRLNQRDGDLGNYIDAISWVSGIVIGFVGVLFGIGAFIFYRESQDIATKAQAQLDAWNEQTADLQLTFEEWFNDAKGVYTGELESLSRMMRLRVVLDQENPTADEVYPDLSPLFSRPQLEYLPIFRKVMALNIGDDINRHTQAAIDQIMIAERPEV